MGNETLLKKSTEVSNYDKFICNIFRRDTKKVGIIRAKVQFICGFKKMGCSRVSSIEIGDMQPSIK